MARSEGRERALSTKSLTFKAVERRQKVVQSFYSDGESSPDDEHDMVTKEERSESISVITHEYWVIVKAMKFLKIGHPHSCLTALSCITECDLQNIMNLNGVMIENGLETLVNLTEVNHPGCVIGALNVFKKITHNGKVIRLIVDLGICINLVKCLTDMKQEINCLACEVIANLGRHRYAARNIRMSGGIKKIVGLLNIKKEILLVDEDSLTKREKKDIHMSHCAALALWSLCTFTKNKKAAQKAGVIPIMSQLILSGNVKVAIPMTGMLCECSSEIHFQKAIETDGLVGMLLHDMSEHDKELNYLCADALANAANGNQVVSHMIRFHGGVYKAMNLLQTSDRRNIVFIAALLKLVWKSAIVLENVKQYEILRASYTIMEFAESSEIRWRTPAIGAVGELAKFLPCRNRLLSQNVMQALVSNLGSSNTQLVTNTTYAIGELVRDEKAIKALEENDGVRLMWSLLTHKSYEVQAQALYSLVPLVAHADDAGELVRSLNNSLNLLVKTLRNGHNKLLGGCCRLIAQVAKDKENLTVMTQHGLVKELSDLMVKEGELLKEAEAKLNVSDMKGIMSHNSTFEAFLNEDPDGVREALAEAIATCSVTSDNSLTFGLSGVISVLAMFLQSKNASLQAQACAALWELSRTEVNSIQIHLCGAVPTLLQIMRNDEPLAQIAASGILANLRRCLLANDIRSLCKFPDSPPMERKEIALK